MRKSHIFAALSVLALLPSGAMAMDCSKDMKAAEDAAAKAPADLQTTVMNLLKQASEKMKAGDAAACSKMLGEAYQKLGLKKQ